MKTHTKAWLWVVVVLFAICTTGGQEREPGAPARNPPVRIVPSTESASVKKQPQAPLNGAPPTTEWTFHKTADGAHPSGAEQEMLWLMNRARNDPSSEGGWLATTGQANVELAITHFGVDLSLMQSEFEALRTRPPAAFDNRLYEAARRHAVDLIARDAQDHTGQFEHIGDVGFHYLRAGGNVFSYMEDAVHAHAGYNIDWGADDDGMQAGRGHRVNKMDTAEHGLINVGLAVVDESDPVTGVGPFVSVENYAVANTTYADHYQAFLVGTVWRDLNGNGRYDGGEGFQQVTVRPETGTYYAVTGQAGGFAIPITTTGSMCVQVTGGDLDVAGGWLDVTVDTDGTLLDIPLHAVSFGSAPTITMDPGDQTVSDGGRATLAVEASGSETLTYEWRLDDVPVPGGGTRVLALDPVTLADEGDYICIVTNDYGSATSAAARLTVLPLPPMIATEPAPLSQVLLEGDATGWTVVATGTALLRYRWRQDGHDVSGGSQATLLLDPVLPGHAGTYDVLVSNDYGSDTSRQVTLDVVGLDEPPRLLAEPVGATLRSGETALFEVQALGAGPLSYQWNIDGQVVDGAVDKTLSWTAPTGAGTYELQVIVGNANGFTAGALTTITVRSGATGALFLLLSD